VSEKPTILTMIYEEQVRQGEKIDALKVDVAKLKIKSGLWGSLSGAATAGIALTLDWLKGN
jgi:hypothetical protein